MTASISFDKKKLLEISNRILHEHHYGVENVCTRLYFSWLVNSARWCHRSSTEATTMAKGLPLFQGENQGTRLYGSIH